MSQRIWNLFQSRLRINVKAILPDFSGRCWDSTEWSSFWVVCWPLLRETFQPITTKANI